MAWHQALPRAELTQDKRKVVTIESKPILLLEHEAKVHAVAVKCPHLQLPLTKGKVCDGALVCPWHKSAFDLATGAVKTWSPWPPVLGKLLGYLKRKTPLTVYATKVEDEHIWIEVA